MSAIEQSIEQVLVLPRNVLDSVCPSQFNTNLGEARPVIEKACFFKARNTVEKDFTLKQIIPYVVVQCGDRFLSIQRTTKQTESRLHNKYSVGVGGHINNTDTASGSVIEAGMRRELNEEISIPGEMSCDLVGIINDDSTEVARVHTGFVFLLKTSSPDFQVMEIDHHQAQWRTTKELIALGDQLESWSQLVLEHIIKLSK